MELIQPDHQTAVSIEPVALRHVLDIERSLEEYVQVNPESSWWELCSLYDDILHRQPENLAIARSVVITYIDTSEVIAPEDKEILKKELEVRRDISASAQWAITR